MRTLLVFLLIVTLPVSALAWGEKGHFMVNRLAIDAAASKLPEFMNASREQLIYNGYEPDRWREETDTPMDIDLAPEHFLDSELWGPIATLPSDRYQFMNQVMAKKVDLIRIGYVPYAILEYQGRLVNAFRQWRNAKTPSDRESARANAVTYAGIMGHFVGDASQPMHMSIHYNGWLDTVPNPKGFTTKRGVHARYEAAYVNAAIEDRIVKPKVQAPRRLDKLFETLKQYMNQAFLELEPIYELEKAGEFNPEQPRPKGTDFIATQIARAATMLSNLWYTAWVESGEPLPKPDAKR